MRRVFLGVASLYLLFAFGHDWVLRPMCQCGTENASPLKKIAGTENLPADLERHVRALYEIGERNTSHYEALEKALNYLQSEWRNNGYSAQHQNFEINGKTVTNLIIERPGEKTVDDSILITANYDSASRSPGANANGSAVAALLALSTYFKNVPISKTVRFAALATSHDDASSEDLSAAKFYAREAFKRNERMHAVISLKSLGYFSNEPHSQKLPFPFRHLYPSEGNFVGIAGFLDDKASRGLVNVATTLFSQASRVPAQCFKSPKELSVDFLAEARSFQNLGYPTLVVTDSGSYRDPNFQTAEDRPEKIDYQKLAEVVRGLIHVIQGISDDTSSVRHNHVG